jgi:hypothetical protein
MPGLHFPSGKTAVMVHLDCQLDCLRSTQDVSKATSGCDFEGVSRED